MKKFPPLLVFGTLLWLPLALPAQTPGRWHPPQDRLSDRNRPAWQGKDRAWRSREFLERNFFRPEMILRYYDELSLSNEQLKTIKEIVLSTQSRHHELDWDLKLSTKTLADSLEAEKLSEEQVMKQLDKILALENEIKKNHLRAAIQLKNLLTSEQQAKLRSIREENRKRLRMLPEEDDHAVNDAG